MRFRTSDRQSPASTREWRLEIDSAPNTDPIAATPDTPLSRSSRIRSAVYSAQRVHRNRCGLACGTQHLDSRAGRVTAFRNRIEDRTEHDKVRAGLARRLNLIDRMSGTPDQFRQPEKLSGIADRKRIRRKMHSVSAHAIAMSMRSLMMSLAPCRVQTLRNSRASSDKSRPLRSFSRS